MSYSDVSRPHDARFADVRSDGAGVHDARDVRAGSDPLLVDVRRAAAMLGVSQRTLWTLTHDGTIPVVRIGSRVLYDPQDLRAFIASRKGPHPNATADRDDGPAER